MPSAARPPEFQPDSPRNPAKEYQGRNEATRSSTPPMAAVRSGPFSFERSMAFLPLFARNVPLRDLACSRMQGSTKRSPKRGYERASMVLKATRLWRWFGEPDDCGVVEY